MGDSADGMKNVPSITEDMIETATERNKLDPTSTMKTMHELPGMTDQQLD